MVSVSVVIPVYNEEDNVGESYRELTDVMQEINGLLSPDRQPKVDPESFRKLNGNPKGR